MRMRRFVRRGCGVVRAAVLAVACVGGLVAAMPAVGQGPSTWTTFQGGSGLHPDILRRDLQLFDEVLALESDQASIITELFRDYSEDVERGITLARAAMREVRPPRTAEENNELRLQQRTLREHMRQIRDNAKQKANDAPNDRVRDRIWQEYEKGAAQIQERIGRLVSDRGAEASMMRDEQVRIAEEWREQQSKITDRFLFTVYALLSEDQQQRWPSLERRLRREKTLAMGELSGESLNVFLILQRLPSDSGVVRTAAALLASYEQRLDTALQRRNEVLAASREPMLAASRAGDAEELVRIGGDIVARRTAVRDTSEQFVQAVKAALPPEDAEPFMAKVNDRAFSRIYRPTRAGRILRTAVRLDDLDPEVREAIVALEQEYLAGLRPINDDLRRLTLHHEPERFTARYLQKAESGGKHRYSKPDDALERAFEVRRRYDVQYMTRLQGLVPNERLRRIPGAAGHAHGLSRGRGGNGLAEQDWAISKFDENGDGVLDDAEKTRLRSYLQQQQRR
ncbi:MAG: hypothetical protein GY715_00980 [Planctomycetes bacterium]|nr:hypothetical protein [Planctomycetota bacterium]